MSSRDFKHVGTMSWVECLKWVYLLLPLLKEPHTYSLASPHHLSAQTLRLQKPECWLTGCSFPGSSHLSVSPPPPASLHHLSLCLAYLSQAGHMSLALSLDLCAVFLCLQYSSIHTDIFCLDFQDVTFYGLLQMVEVPLTCLPAVHLVFALLIFSYFSFSVPTKK